MEKTNIGGVPVAVLTEYGFINELETMITSGKKGWLIFSLNAEGFCRFKENQYFRDSLLSADLVHADGMSIVWISKLYGEQLPEKLSTTDMIYPVADWAAKRRLSFFLLGGNYGAAEMAAERLIKMYPELNIVGTHHGYFNSNEEEKVIAKINEVRPDILWVGFGRPKQEIWTVRNRSKLNVPIIKTCGGLFDFVSGKNKRAPTIMQRYGLEWLYRLYLEPRRLYKRYLIGNFKFLHYVVKDVVKVYLKMR